MTALDMFFFSGSKKDIIRFCASNIHSKQGGLNKKEMQLSFREIFFILIFHELYLSKNPHHYSLLLIMNYQFSSFGGEES